MPPQQQQQFPQQSMPPQQQYQSGPPAGASGWHRGLSLAEFETLFQQEARTPEGAVKCLLVAAIESYGEPKNPDGLKMYGMCLPKNDAPGGEPPRHAFFHSQWGKQAGRNGAKNAPIPSSYLGGTPANHYTPDYNFRLTQHPTYKTAHKNTEDDVKIVFQSGGKDSPTPVRLKKNKHGIWKVVEYSSLYTGVKTDEDLTDF